MRVIDLPPYARGWFAIGLCDDVAAGDVIPIHYFGRELVLYRSEAGQAVLLDAYCPHLGAHLGHGGVVVGDDLKCPFHGWRFGQDGGCTGMPYGKVIPPKARTKSWALAEQNGVILAWHDAAGGEPDWQMKRFEDESWTPPASRRWEIAGHTQEVLENTADLAHFRFVHGTHVMRALSSPKIDGPNFEVPLESDPEALEPTERLEDAPLLEGSSYCFGPGLTAANVVPKGSNLVAMQRLYTTPIDEERIALLGIVNVGELATPRETRALHEALSAAVFSEWEADIPIWEHKRYRAKPALNDTEGVIPVFRRWYAQFYAGTLGR